MKTAITEKNSRNAYMTEFKANQEREEDKESFQRVLNTKEGRWFLMRILDIAGYKSRSFTGNSQTFYNEGKRAVGIELIEKVMFLLEKDGFNLHQLAEKEYIEFQERQRLLFIEREDHE